MWQHGTLTGYSYHKCRCPKCSAVARENRKKYQSLPKRFSAVLVEGIAISKTCSRCRIEKPIIEFGINRSRKDGFNGVCKECVNLRPARMKLKNRPKKKMGRPRLPDEHGTLYMYRRGCQCDKCQEAHLIYYREYIVSDNTRIARSLGHRVRIALKNSQRVGSAVRDLGCTISEFRVYLESQFTEGMTWNNYGFGMDKWNIDHIKPIGTFDLRDREQLLIAVHYTNLRPLWQKDNIRRPKDGSDMFPNRNDCGTIAMA